MVAGSGNMFSEKLDFWVNWPRGLPQEIYLVHYLLFKIKTEI